MAHHRSAQKRIRQTIKRTVVNRNRIGRIRTFIKQVELAVAEGDSARASEAFRLAEPEIRRGVSNGVLHRNTASRKISRMAKRVQALATAAG